MKLFPVVVVCCSLCLSTSVIAKSSATSHAHKKPGVTAHRSVSALSKKQKALDINTASEAQWQALAGIGHKTALRLVAYRKKNGMFHSLKDLLQVKGMSEKKLEKLGGLIICHAKRKAPKAS